LGQSQRPQQIGLTTQASKTASKNAPQMAGHQAARKLGEIDSDQNDARMRFLLLPEFFQQLRQNKKRPGGRLFKP
jgi:hypothetical protein